MEHLVQQTSELLSQHHTLRRRSASKHVGERQQAPHFHLVRLVLAPELTRAELGLFLPNGLVVDAESDDQARQGDSPCM